MTNEKKPTHPTPAPTSKMTRAEVRTFIEGLDLRTARTSNLILMLHEGALIDMFREIHAQTSPDDRKAIILAIAAEIDVRIPVPRRLRETREADPS